MSLSKLQLMLMGLEFLLLEDAKVKLLDVTWLPITKSWLMLLLLMFTEENSRSVLDSYMNW
jgi:K+ transporter